MVDELATSDVVGVLSQQLETMSANDSHQNSHERGTNRSILITNPNTINHYSSDCPKSITNNDGHKFKLPAINVPENIIIVLDMVEENDCTPFEYQDNRNSKPIELIKKAIGIFIRSKQFINRNHRYALIILNEDSAKWIHNFGDGNTILYELQRINKIPSLNKQKTYDLSKCFQEITSKISLQDDIEYPLCVNRVILIYTRSNSVPTLTNRKIYEKLINYKYFFFDVLFVHEPANGQNYCHEIYEQLNNLNMKNNSWIFEVGRSAAKLYNSMAKLLAHPLQRPEQDNAQYQIFMSENSEKQTNI